MWKGKLRCSEYGDCYVSYWSDDLCPLSLKVTTNEHIFPVWENNILHYKVGDAVTYEIVENQKLSGIVKYAKITK